MHSIQFSVSMCVYGKDHPDWFKTAVDSVLNQTVMPSEVVLVVDGPVPDSLGSIIRQYEKMPVFKVIWLPENQGHGNARRLGLEKCSFEYVALMDSDDICIPDRFEQQLAYFADEELSIVGGDISEFIDSPENCIAKRSVPCIDSEIKEYMKKRCPMNQVSVMFRKGRVQLAGGYLDWFCEEDYYLWLRMALAGYKMANTGTILVNVRVGQEMYKRRGGLKYFRSEARLQKYMLDNRIIGNMQYLINVGKRFVIQILLPNRLRSFVYAKFAREKAGQNNQYASAN